VRRRADTTGPRRSPPKRGSAAPPPARGAATAAPPAGLAALLLAGCASIAPSPLALPSELDDLQTKSAGDLTVSVAILRDEQAREHFGVDLAADDLHALWMEIENESPHTLWLLRNGVDPDFYPPDEAAHVVGDGLSSEAFELLRQHLRDESIRVMLPPASTTRGFLYVPRTEGGRYVDVRLMRDAFEAELARSAGEADGGAPGSHARSLWRLGFAVPLPDGLFDYERLDTAHTYGDAELPDLDGDELRRRLEDLPPCATDDDGERDGDPLNVVIVGEGPDVLNSLSRSGWSFTHRISFASIRRLVGAAIGGDAYPVAPVSDLHLFGRRQDVALQRARASIAQRNHMRLWLAPFTHAGRQVWVGQVSRDVGIELTTAAPTLTTHVIDPEVDVTREYLLHSLLAEGFVERFGFVRGAPAAPRERPALNLTGDPYFSDGMRLVVVLSPQPVPYDRVRSLLWERSAAPVAEGQSDAASRNVRPAE